MGERLESWKEIAAYLGREVRTVQRWAQARRLPVHRLPGGARPRVFSLKPEIDTWLHMAAREPREDAASVAVLPFLNLAGDEEGQSFGDGLADDVINALVRVPGLRVTARTSSFAFSGRGHDVRDIGARLGAAWVLEGSVRRDRKRVRVSAQLVSCQDGYHAWSEWYDRDLKDIFAIQDDIARSIALALKVKLSAEPAATRPTDDLVAYELWVSGRSVSQQLTPDAFVKARDHYESAIARDPQFALPYFGLADLLLYGAQFGLTPSSDAAPRARAAITRSLELNDMFGEAHALRGILQGILDYDWPGAEASFERAFQLSPGSAAVLAQHAWYQLVPRMQIAQAAVEASQAVAQDPLSPVTHAVHGLVLTVARKPGQAVEACQRAVDLAPGLWWLRWFYGSALLMAGRPVRGFQQCRKAYEVVHHPLAVGGMCAVYGIFRQSRKARQMLSELHDIARTADVPPLAFAWAYLGLGDDRVFEWLEKAVDARDPAVTHMPSMPIYDSIRDDARFRALIAKMHLA